MKFKFLGVILLAVFAISSTSCKSGKSCKGGGWYGNRNLSYEAKDSDQKPNADKKNTYRIPDTEACETVIP